VLLIILAMAVPAQVVPARAQQPADVPVVGLLVTHAAVDDPIFDQLRAGLRELGYEDRRNMRLEIVTAAGKLDRLPDLAQELVRRRARVILAPNEASIRAALKASRTIPIVMVGGQGYDPVALGMIESFARPGGNVTGMYGLWSELEAKLIELVKEALPGVSLVAVFWETGFGRSALAGLQRSAQALGVRVEPIEVRQLADLEAAFVTAKRKRAGAVILLSSPIFYLHRNRIGALGLQTKLPVISAFKPVAEAGALMSYGPDIDAVWRRTAYYVDRLLKGAAPADLPVEQASKLMLVVNLETARALGVSIPESILLRADEVIR
jgi:putative ABC transport system substrate-binding protein